MPLYSLKTLLQPWVNIDPLEERTITGLCADSRLVQPGNLFIALEGLSQNGAVFIEEALKQGAIAVLYEAGASDNDLVTDQKGSDSQVPMISMCALRALVGQIAARFYDNPSSHLKVIGVTGTNGKTSCSHWISHALTFLGQPCGVMGTLGYGIPNGLTSNRNSSTHYVSEGMDITSQELTTPGPIQVQKRLAHFVNENIPTVCMEVSSHGLAQNRVEGVLFDVAIFTNLSQDHLDYHGNMENYALTKKRLFSNPSLKKRIFNVDDNHGLQWFSEYMNKEAICMGYSLNPEMQTKISSAQLVYTSKIHLSQHGIAATVHSPWGVGELKAAMMGRFNLSNLLAVLTALCLQDVPFEKALESLSYLKSPPGRMEILGGNERPQVIIDFAHTPDALEQVLKSLSEHCNGKLWCVFGCGGDRDASKRSMMGKIVEKYADVIIVTDDNPRHEKPSDIVIDILKGLAIDSTATVEHDRREAIRQAVTCAKLDDIIVIAGKGHERYQQIGDEKLPFNDKVEVLLALDSLNQA